MEPFKTKGQEIITEQPPNSQSDNESSGRNKTRRPKNARHPSGALEKISSKLLTLLNMSFWFLSKKISILEAKIFLKTLNNTRSVLKTYLKKNFPSQESRNANIMKIFPAWVIS